MIKFPGLFEVALLIALGFGYIVLYLAKREEKRMQFLGYIIGVTIITLSLIYLVGYILMRVIYSPRISLPKGMMQQRPMPPDKPRAPAQKP